MSSTVFRSEHPLIAYRIGAPTRPLLDGTGAASSDVHAGISRGRYIIYAAEHYATALLKKSAQLGTLRIPRTLVFARIDVTPGVPVEEVRPEDCLVGMPRARRRVSALAIAGATSSVR